MARIKRILQSQNRLPVSGTFLTLLMFGCSVCVASKVLAEPVKEKKSQAAFSNKQASKKLNFVIILIDDLGWADVGFNGSTFYHTPNLDKLARQSIQFNNAYAAAPVCSPTRAALLTGKYPARLHLTDWLPGRADNPSQLLLRANLKAELPLDEKTLPEALKGAGYVSAHIGKWHLGEGQYSPTQQGFDVNVGGDHAGVPANYFYPYVNPTSKAIIPGLENGQNNEYLTDRLTLEAEKFIDQNKQRPFFLYLPHFAVHIPMKAKEALIKKYQALAKSDAVQNNAIYAAMIESVDESVGRIMQKLEDLNLNSNTVIMFTSDNGGLSVKEGANTPATSNYPLREGKGHLYEGGIRVPLFIHMPGKKSYTTSTPVISNDLFATVLELAGVKGGTNTNDAKSLVPLLDQKPFPGRNLYWHYPHYSNQGGKPGWAIRNGDFKLIQFFEDNHTELYNIKTDPGEQTNLAANMADKAASLLGQLQLWGRKVGAQLMKPNPDYKKENK
jgi:arylsulfatase A-like enzyme